MFKFCPTNPRGKWSSSLVRLPDKSKAQFIHNQRPTSRIFVPSGIRTLVLLLVPLSDLPLHHTHGGKVAFSLATIIDFHHYFPSQSIVKLWNPSSTSWNNLITSRKVISTLPLPLAKIKPLFSTLNWESSTSPRYWNVVT